MSYRENTSQRIDISFSMKYYLTFKCKRKGTLRKTRSSLHFSKSLLEALFLMALPCHTKNVGSEKQAEKPGNKLVLPVKLTPVTREIYTMKVFHRWDIQKSNPCFSAKSRLAFPYIFLSQVSQPQLQSHKLYTGVQWHLSCSERKAVADCGSA